MLDAVDITSNQLSSATNVTNLDRCSISLAWTGGGTPVGTVTVEARQKDANKASADQDWFTVDFGATISISGNSGSHLLIMDNLDFTDIRVRYTATSGSATLTAVLTAKQVGG